MTLFSVDVETSGLDPHRHRITGFSVVEVETEAHVTYRLPDLPERDWHEATLEWWDANRPATWADLPVITRWRAPIVITEFLAQFPRPWTFMAWPASFDYPFLQQLFGGLGQPWPFDYRTLDVKSWLAGRFGIDVSADRSEVLDGIIVPPEYPHDPYHDALAQARTFKAARERV
jgi:DNA polymerase III epsilon subunit-like protein